MTQYNKHGVSRNIPEPIKREVRQRCGFGCVNCGSPIYDYEHWNPPFEDLKDCHKAEGIALCCPMCHRKKGGLISNEEYENNIRNPYSMRIGSVKTKWSAGKEIDVQLGNVICKNGTRIFTFNNNVILGFLPSKDENCPPLLQCVFHDRNGQPTFMIVGNQIIGNTNSWDLTSKSINGGGWEWCVRSAKGKIDLLLEILPPNKVFIKQLNLVMGFVSLVANKNGCGIMVREQLNTAFISKTHIDGGNGGTISPKNENHGLFEVTLQHTNGIEAPPVLNIRTSNMIFDRCGPITLG